MAHLGSPGQRAIKRVCVCVCVFLVLAHLGSPGQHTHTHTHLTALFPELPR